VYIFCCITEPIIPQQSTAILQETVVPQESVEVQGSTNSSQSSDSGTLTFVVVIAVGNVIGLFICIFIVFFGVLYLGKKKQPSSPNRAYPELENPVSSLEQVMEENICTTDCTTAPTGNLMYTNPLKQPKSTVREVVNSKTNLKVTNPILHTNTVTELDIYDDVVNSPLTLRKLQESDCYETYDYNKQDLDDDTGSYISMCVPIYDNPACME